MAEQRQSVTAELESRKRLRAPASEGGRTTLRVPPDLMEAADRLAVDEGTSRNAALIALARRGAAQIAAEADMGQVRERIRQAVLGPLSDVRTDGHPSPREWSDAILEPRGERLP